MTDDQQPNGASSYQREIRKRTRRFTAATRARAFTMQLMWVVILAAGAAVPLAAALNWHEWVGPTLGFVVVVASGIERIFGRTTSAAVAVDGLRRELDRQTRMFGASALDYAQSEDPFGLYVQRVEDAIASFDEMMLAHAASMSNGFE